MATTDTQLQQLVINVGTDAQIKAGIASGTITEDMLSIATDGADITYDWIGTLAEYNDQDIKTQHPDWLCFITDDVNNAGEDVYDNVYSKAEADETFVSKVDNLPQYLPSLFEFKWSDCLLNRVSWLRADTFSWQSGKIYEAAYNHLSHDIEGKTLTTEYIDHNVELIGNATVDENGILSGFISNNSFGIVKGLHTPSTSLEMVVKIHIPSVVTSSNIWNSAGSSYQGLVIRITSNTNANLWLSSNGSSWNVANGVANTADFTPNTDRWIKLTWDGSNYVMSVSTDGILYTTTSTTASTLPLYFNKGLVGLGGCSYSSEYPFTGGTIDLKESYIKINNALVWQGMNSIQYYEADDKHRVCLPDQENTISKLYNKYGVAWYYILDTDNERFKLPRTKFGFQGLRDSVGKLIKPGLPQPELLMRYDGVSAANAPGWVTPTKSTETYGTDGTTVRSVSGAYNNTGGTDEPMLNVNIWNKWARINKASTYKTITDIDLLDNDIYGNSNTVQSPATQMYLYFYVGEFTQDAITNTAGVTTEILNTKVDKGHEVIEFQVPTEENDYTWYRKYADGWIEQGQNYVALDSNGQSFTMPIIMSDDKYNIQCTGVSGSNKTSTAVGVWIGVYTRTTSTFTCYSGDDTTFNACYMNWQVSGMYAQ